MALLNVGMLSVRGRVPQRQDFRLAQFPFRHETAVVYYSVWTELVESLALRMVPHHVLVDHAQKLEIHDGQVHAMLRLGAVPLDRLLVYLPADKALNAAVLRSERLADFRGTGIQIATLSAAGEWSLG